MSSAVLVIFSLGGCQLLQLPFQLIGGILSLAVKLVPILPLFLYVPADSPPGGPTPDGEEVRLAAIERVDNDIRQLQAAGDEAALPALDARSLERSLSGHRLVGVVFVPVGHLAAGADRLRPALAELEAQGYHVEVGELVDGSSLQGDDLLAQARFVRQSQRLDVSVVAPATLDTIETPLEESDLQGRMSEDLLALVD